MNAALPNLPTTTCSAPAPRPECSSAGQEASPASLAFLGPLARALGIADAARGAAAGSAPSQAPLLPVPPVAPSAQQITEAPAPVLAEAGRPAPLRQDLLDAAPDAESQSSQAAGVSEPTPRPDDAPRLPRFRATIKANDQAADRLAGAPFLPSMPAAPPVQPGPVNVAESDPSSGEVARATAHPRERRAASPGQGSIALGWDSDVLQDGTASAAPLAVGLPSLLHAAAGQPTPEPATQALRDVPPGYSRASDPRREAGSDGWLQAGRLTSAATAAPDSTLAAGREVTPSLLAPARHADVTAQHPDEPATGVAAVSDDKPALPGVPPSAHAATVAAMPATPIRPAESAAMAAAPTASPTAQLAPALFQITAAPDGTHRVTVRLDPVELGELRVRIERPRAGPVQVVVEATRPETLELLRQDQPALHRALDQAGLPAEGRVVSLQQVPPDMGGQAQGGSGTGGASLGGGGQGGDRGGNQGWSHPGGGEGAPRGRGSRQATWARAGLDITA